MTTELLDRGCQRGRGAGVRDYISPSRLALWLKCPLAFRLQYVEGFRSPSSPAAFVGKMVHAALEAFYRHRQLGLALDACDLAIRLGQGWDAATIEEGVKFASKDDEAAYRRQAVGLVTAYLAKLADDEPRPLAVEVSLEAPLIDPRSGEDLGIPLVGIIDLVLTGGPGLTIVDFKTAARGGAMAEIVHELQLTSYAYLLRHAADQAEAGLEIRQIIKTKTPQVQTHRFGRRSEAHFRRLFAVVRAYLDDLDQGRFVFRPGLACGMCEFRNRQCREWKG